MQLGKERHLKARLIGSQEIAPGVRHFTFEVPEVNELPYLPGQFVSLTRELDGKVFTRAYSTASPPSGNRFDLCLNCVPEGHFSPFLFNMELGDTVSMQGPLGYFTWKNPPSDSLLVATGTGVAPFRSMINHYLAAGGNCNLTLILGVRYERSLLYRAEWEHLARLYPNFRFVPVLSRPEPEWTGRTGHVQEHVLELLDGRKDMDVYICGMKAMVDDLRSRLKAVGLDRKRIIVEKYD